MNIVFCGNAASRESASTMASQRPARRVGARRMRSHQSSAQGSQTRAPRTGIGCHPASRAQVIPELQADGATERRRTAEADLAAQQVGAEGGEDEVEERDDEHAAVDVDDEETRCNG